MENIRKEKSSQRGLSPCSASFTVLSCLVNVGGGQGARLLHRSCATALFLALMPAIQGSQKIGLGDSLKVITWDSGNSRWLLRAAPECSGDASSAVHFRGFHYFSCLFLAGARGGVFMSSHHLIFLFFFFFYQSLCFFEREGSLLPKPLCPTVGFKETGPCN